MDLDDTLVMVEQVYRFNLTNSVHFAINNLNDCCSARGVINTLKEHYVLSGPV